MHIWLNQSERGSNKKRFQYCLDPDEHIPRWAIQGHSGGNSVDLSLQDNEQIPHDWMEHIHHVGSSISCSSKIRSGLIAGGEIGKDDKTVFFTAVDPRSEPQSDEPYDVAAPRVVPYRTNWKVYQNAVYWINLKSAQDRGLVIWQTNSNGIILDDSVPADSLEKVVHDRKGGVMYQKICLSLRPPPKLILKGVWQVEQESIGRPVADQVTIRPEVDLRFQGVPDEEPQQDEENSRKQYIGRFVHAIVFHPNKDALISELQSDTPRTPFSEKST